jgi:hypothetical protein
MVTETLGVYIVTKALVSVKGDEDTNFLIVGL